MRLLIILLLVLIGFRVWAEEPSTPAAPPPTTVIEAPEEGGRLADDFRKQKFMFKVGTSDYDYEEPGLMSIKGRLTTVETSFRNLIGHRSRPMWYSIYASYAFTSNDTYNGGL